jgi:para-nitrobenzyl esterase
MIVESKTNYRTLRGIKKQGYVVYRGIPYAAPPLGALRWKKPKPPAAWDGIREVKCFGPRDLQIGQPDGSFYQKGVLRR